MWIEGITQEFRIARVVVVYNTQNTHVAWIAGYDDMAFQEKLSLKYIHMHTPTTFLKLT